MRRIRLLQGPVLLGFADAFDATYGDPLTPTPYPCVTPSTVGTVLLPFACPRCGVALNVAGLILYRDPSRGFRWCPKCQGRFTLDLEGSPLATSLPAGSIMAPSLINGKLGKAPDPSEGSLELLGCMR